MSWKDDVEKEAIVKDELLQRAGKLGIKGRSKMSKADLARAIARKQ